MGKTYHPGLPPNNDGELSWTDPSRYSQGGETPLLPGSPPEAAIITAPHYEEVMAASTCITGEPGGSYCEINGTAGPDDHLMEAGVASVKLLANYSSVTKQPFFLAVGFHKPHIPWTIPTRFFNEEHGVPPTIDETELPTHPAVPTGMPPMAWNRGLGHNALDSYKDANRYPLHTNVTFPDPLVKAMRRGYRAAVAYMDWMTGNVLEALNTSSVADHTVVLFLGDHGCLLRT